MKKTKIVTALAIAAFAQGVTPQVNDILDDDKNNFSESDLAKLLVIDKSLSAENREYAFKYAYSEVHLDEAKTLLLRHVDDLISGKWKSIESGTLVEVEKLEATGHFKISITQPEDNPEYEGLYQMLFEEMVNLA